MRDRPRVIGTIHLAASALAGGRVFRIFREIPPRTKSPSLADFFSRVFLVRVAFVFSFYLLLLPVFFLFFSCSTSSSQSQKRLGNRNALELSFRESREECATSNFYSLPWNSGTLATNVDNFEPVRSRGRMSLFALTTRQVAPVAENAPRSRLVINLRD